MTGRRLTADRSVRAALFFAALYHDVEKPATKTFDEDGRIRFFDHDIKGAKTAVRRAEAFNLSNEEVKRIHTIIQHHMRFHFFTSRLNGEQKEPSRRAIYRFFRDAGEAGVDLVLLGLADLRGTYGTNLTQGTWTAALDIAHLLRENNWEKREETVAPPRLLDGNDLINALNLKPGPVIGDSFLKPDSPLGSDLSEWLERGFVLEREARFEPVGNPVNCLNSKGFVLCASKVERHRANLF